ncbi:lipocalin family protein [Fulvivirga sediminis]|uniref:Outer membrane lipoprotein Blc n=1 Tax=Fulvivirga sediminis TaxID=2803949 RepID=A0A937FB39_9BACT|nr:lipocalin family protein [Fulvivirga sediminis]MBL3657328.1 lipocalin family protein [Fulvivirga sediminis]
MKKKHIIYTASAVIAIGAATFLLWPKKNIPQGVEAVKSFNKERYLGKWYEIARFDFRFEKGLSHVTAEYSLNSDGTIKVINRGYNAKKDEFNEAIGKAKFVKDDSIAELKVSFFGPFYSGYNVIAIDPDYQNALVVGKNRDYMWLLSRNTEMPEDIKKAYLNLAEKHGFDTSKLLWTKHDKSLITP